MDSKYDKMESLLHKVLFDEKTRYVYQNVGHKKLDINLNAIKFGDVILQYNTNEITVRGSLPIKEYRFNIIFPDGSPDLEYTSNIIYSRREYTRLERFKKMFDEKYLFENNVIGYEVINKLVMGKLEVNISNDKNDVIREKLNLVIYKAINASRIKKEEALIDKLNLRLMRYSDNSRFLSLVLRHKPQQIGLRLDKNGWVNVDMLLKALHYNGREMTKEDLESVVENNDKKRFEFNLDKTEIRASQGHSIKVDLELIEETPPSTLYHGTVEKSIEQIKVDGLKSMSRHHLHLSADVETAVKVGSRRGNALLLVIDTRAMLADGYKFYKSANGVWLTDIVPYKYIKSMAVSKSRTLVIGDIHGGLKGVKQVIERAEVSEEDRLIFIGDYVDGWEESAGVIDYLIELNGKYNCIFIRGNHDEWAEQWLQNGVPSIDWTNHGGLSTIRSYFYKTLSQRDKHHKFFRAMHNYFIDEDNNLFVHGGFKSDGGVKLDGQYELLWDRSLFQDAYISANLASTEYEKTFYYPKRAKLYNEIFLGHTTTFSWEEDKPLNALNIWNVDTGAGTNGKLTIMDVKTKKFWQSDALRKLYPNDVHLDFANEFKNKKKKK